MWGKIFLKRKDHAVHLISLPGPIMFYKEAEIWKSVQLLFTILGRYKADYGYARLENVTSLPP